MKNVKPVGDRFSSKQKTSPSSPTNSTCILQGMTKRQEDQVAEDILKQEIDPFITELVEKIKLEDEESPRALIILLAAYIDDQLTKLLKNYLAVPPVSKDDLFCENGPLFNLGVKISMAQRLGLISNDMAWLINMVKKVRNKCAHGHLTLNLDSGQIADIIDEAYRALDTDKHPADTGLGKMKQICIAILITLGLKNKNVKKIMSAPREAGGPFPK